MGYADSLANNKRWLATQKAIVWLGDAYLLAVPVRKLEQKPKARLITREYPRLESPP